MCDLPGPGLESVSPALAGRFLTTAPPGKPQSLHFTGKETEVPGRRSDLPEVTQQVGLLVNSEQVKNQMNFEKSPGKTPY